MLDFNLGIIGAGNMASAIIKGIINNNIMHSKNITIYDVDNFKQEKFIKDFNLTKANNLSDLFEKNNFIIIAIRPNDYEDLLGDIKPFVQKKHIIISIAAGITIDYIKTQLERDFGIVRVMPNTPSLIGEGVSVIASNHNLNESSITIIENLFSSFSKVIYIDESLFNAVTALSGSSPAYVYMFIEALVDGGVLMGLNREDAYIMATQSIIGAAKMVNESKDHPGILKDLVASPGGTTIEAIYSLEKNNFRGTIIEAVKSCTLKGELMDKILEEKRAK